MHEDELVITDAVARALVDEQFPRWRGLPLAPYPSTGTVNRLYRLGSTLAVRFPLLGTEPRAARTELEAEAQAARELQGRTPFATPEPVALGEPGQGFPMPWTVQSWVAGRSAFEEDPGQSVYFARDLATFVSAVRALDARGRVFDRAGRGGDLSRHDAWVATSTARGSHLFDAAHVTRLWSSLRILPRPHRDAMTHGDLTPGNVLVADQRLAGVIDVGGLGPTDPALDLVSAWHLLETKPRQTFRELLGSDDEEWRRGMAWALEQALGAAWYYETSNPSMSMMGQRTIGRILTADAGA